tara:strand:+ start:681 stop:902 length:222 start_codon:yes stop_codon:yes gene_type:complete
MVITTRTLHQIRIHLMNIIPMICAGAMKSLFGDILITVTITVVLGTSVTAVGKSGVTLIKHADGSIIKDGVIN